MMLVIFLMLTHAVSLAPRGVMDVAIYNQYLDIELVSPVCFCDCGIYNEHPVARTDVGAMMKISFQFGLEKLPGGILMCEVQREGNIESDCQFSTDTTSIEAAEDTSKITRLLVAWKIEHFGEPIVRIILVEYDRELVLNEDRLAKLYDKVNEQFPKRYNPSRYTWLLSTNTVLETTYEVAQREGLELKIAISEGVKDWNTRAALWIDPKR
jgi:hypothetical protein